MRKAKRMWEGYTELLCVVHLTTIALVAIDRSLDTFSTETFLLGSSSISPVVLVVVLVAVSVWRMWKCFAPKLFKEEDG